MVQHRFQVPTECPEAGRTARWRTAWSSLLLNLVILSIHGLGDSGARAEEDLDSYAEGVTQGIEAREQDETTVTELLVLAGHEGLVLSVAFSPDGTRLATGSFDNTARLWDASTGKELAVLKGHESDVMSVAFRPDGTRLATGSQDNTARLWDASTGKELAVLKGHESYVLSVAFRRGKGASHQIWVSCQILQFWWLAPFSRNTGDPSPAGVGGSEGV